MGLENQFESIVEGFTYKSKTQEHTFYTIINHNDEGKVIEIFVRINDADLFEMITLITVLASNELESGKDPLKIAKELKNIYSPATRHMIPGTNIMCPSIIARIGLILEEHIKFLDNKFGEKDGN
jgi:hypothetical protein